MQKVVIHNYLRHCITNPQPPGLGDFVRGTIALFNYSKIYGYKLLIDKSHPIFSHMKDDNELYYIQVGSKEASKEVSQSECIELLPPISYWDIDPCLRSLFEKGESFTIMTNSFYYCYKTGNFGNFGEISDECKSYLRNIFTPNEELSYKIRNIYRGTGPYSIIHMRLGDKFIHNPEYFDQNMFNTLNARIESFLENHNDKKFILVSDSDTCALELSRLHPSLTYWSNKKIHLGDLLNVNTDVEEDVVDTLVDFYIMKDSQYIFNVAPSGFSRIVSLIYDIPYISIP